MAASGVVSGVADVDPVERVMDELGACRGCGDPLPEELLRYSIEWCEACAGVPEVSNRFYRDLIGGDW